MVDEIYDRSYQSARTELNAGLGRAFSSAARELGKSFAAIHRYQWRAPWNSKSRDIECV